MTDKKALSERDVITQYIIPAIEKAGWSIEKQVREEVFFTDGRIFVKGSKTARGERKRADIVLYYKPNIPIAIIEAKDNTHTIGAGLQQALNYSEILDIPVAFSSNGDGFLEHDRSGYSSQVERSLTLDNFPSPQELWEKYKKFKGIDSKEQETIISYDYFFDGSGRKPRYYQQVAINRTVEAIAKGQKRALLVMATGTGKTYTAFFPLPPLAEQSAIVERVDRLLGMVDDLEKQVSERKHQAEALMQAVLREAFEGKA